MVTSSIPLPMMWKKVRKISDRFSPSTPPVPWISGVVVSNHLTVASAMAAHFSSVSVKDLSMPHTDGHLHQERINLDFHSHGAETYNTGIDFTVRELHAAPLECRDTTPASDELRYAMFRHLPPASLDFIVPL